MNDEKKLEIKAILLEEWDNYENKADLARMLEEGYIFGKYATNEHYNIDEYWTLIREIEAEKNPVEEINEE